MPNPQQGEHNLMDWEHDMLLEVIPGDTGQSPLQERRRRCHHHFVAQHLRWPQACVLCCQASLLQVCLSRLADAMQRHRLQSKEATCPRMTLCCPSSLIWMLGSRLLPQALAAHLSPETCVSYASQPVMMAPSLTLHLFQLDGAASWLFAHHQRVVFPQQAVPVHPDTLQFLRFQEPSCSAGVG